MCIGYLYYSPQRFSFGDEKVIGLLQTRYRRNTARGTVYNHPKRHTFVFDESMKSDGVT